MKPKISFVLICHNERERAVNCIESIKALKTRHKYEIFLVDNESADGTVAEIRKKFRDVNVIALQKNIGTPAYNAGVKRSKGEYVFFTASDVELKNDMLDPLIGILDENKGVAQACPKYYNLFDRENIDLAGTWLSRSFYSGVFKKDALGYETAEIPYMGTGLVRNSVLRRLGYLFDDDYFIYGEDVDFGLRVRLLGYRIMYCPQSVVYHAGSVSRSIHKQHYLTFLMERNLLTTFFKIMSGKSILIYLPYVILVRLAAIFRDILGLKFLNAAARLRAMSWILSNFNFVLKKRHETQKLRKVDDKELLGAFSEKHLFE